MTQEISKRIKQLVQECPVNAYNLSKILDVSPTTMTYVMTGRNKPSADLIIKLSNYFNVTSDWILGLTDTRKTLDSTK